MGEQSRSLSRRTFIGGAAVFGAATFLTPSFAYAAPTLAELQAEADQVRVQVNSIQAELTTKREAFWVAQDEYDAAVAAMEEAQARIDEATGKILEHQGKLGMRARSMYRSGNTSMMDLILGATSFEEFVTSWDMLNKMNEDDAELVATTKDLRTEIEEQQIEFAKQEKIAAEKLKEAETAKNETEAVASQYQATLDSLDAEVRDIILAEQQAAVETSAAQAASQQSSGGSSGQVPAPPGGGYGDVVSYAAQFIGYPYADGGDGPPKGFDCSGFVCYVLRNCGHSVPPRSTGGYPGGGWFSVSQAQPGDVLWQPNHVAICASAGGGSYIHAADKVYNVCWGSSPQFQRAYRY